MRLYFHIFLLVAILHCSYAPPVTPDKKEHENEAVDDLVSIEKH